MKIIDIKYHRNGVVSEGFHAITFREGKRKMLGVVFHDYGKCAVFDTADLETKWRADFWENRLRNAIREWSR